VKIRTRKRLQARLMTAAGFGNAKWVAALLRAGADPSLPDCDAQTPLYLASVQNKAGNVRVLLRAGADPNVESGSGEQGLPLCAAACWGHDEVVQVLLLAGADPSLREDRGQGLTALQWAVNGSHRTTVEMLQNPAATALPAG
jgi:ankyrin repeat protein